MRITRTGREADPHGHISKARSTIREHRWYLSVLHGHRICYQRCEGAASWPCAAYTEAARLLAEAGEPT